MWEVFNTVTGRTVAHVASKSAAVDMVQRCGGGHDYDKAAAGFYVVGMAGRATGAAPYASREAAQSAADMRNMGSDYDSFSVREA